MRVIAGPDEAVNPFSDCSIPTAPPDKMGQERPAQGLRRHERLLVFRDGAARISTRQMTSNWGGRPTAAVGVDLA
jgi:hypothetical protein